MLSINYWEERDLSVKIDMEARVAQDGIFIIALLFGNAATNSQP